jgi:hypothetical protein
LSSQLQTEQRDDSQTIRNYVDEKKRQLMTLRQMRAVFDERATAASIIRMARLPYVETTMMRDKPVPLTPESAFNLLLTCRDPDDDTIVKLKDQMKRDGLAAFVRPDGQSNGSGGGGGGGNNAEKRDDGRSKYTTTGGRTLWWKSGDTIPDGYEEKVFQDGTTRLVNKKKQAFTTARTPAKNPPQGGQRNSHRMDPSGNVIPDGYVWSKRNNKLEKALPRCEDGCNCKDFLKNLCFGKHHLVKKEEFDKMLTESREWRDKNPTEYEALEPERTKRRTAAAARNAA